MILLCCNVFLIVLIFFFIVLLHCQQNEYFSTPEDKHNTWKSRIKELKGVPKLYLNYFKNTNTSTPSSSSVELQPRKIFVSIASYRDDQCSDTLTNVIKQADRPEDLHIFICQQNELIDEDCLARTKKSTAKIHIERLPSTQAKGPVWARSRIQRYWSGEEYYLQIDSHTRLIKSWDTILINQLNMCTNPEKSILTQYPLEFNNVSKQFRNDPIKEKWNMGKQRNGLYIQKIGKEGFTRIQSDYTQDIVRQPYKSIGWAAGFSFSKGTIVKDVPIDPYLYLFFGEQMDMAIRAYTHGYDLYSPTQTIAYHIYSRDHRKTFWELIHQKPLEILSRFRIYVKLGMIRKRNIPKEYRSILIDLDKYNLGHERTLEEYEKEAKINLREEELSE